MSKSTDTTTEQADMHTQATEDHNHADLPNDETQRKSRTFDTQPPSDTVEETPATTRTTPTPLAAEGRPSTATAPRLPRPNVTTLRTRLEQLQRTMAERLAAEPPREKHGTQDGMRPVRR